MNRKKETIHALRVFIALLFTALSAYHSDALSTVQISVENCLSNLPKDAENASLRVVSCIGSSGTGKKTLLRSLFGNGINDQLAVLNDGLVVLRAESSFADKRDAATAFAIADIVIYNVFISDLSRSLSSFISELQSSIEPYVASCAHSTDSFSKKSLVIALRDFDDEDFSKDDISKSITDAMNKMWNRIVRPGILSNKSLDDMFAISFSFLPHSKLSSDEFYRNVELLRAEFKEDSISSSPSDILKHLQDIVSQFSGSTDSVSSKEINATPIAKNALLNSLALFKNRIATLTSTAAEGLDTEFGSHIDSTIEDVMRNFSKLTESVSGTSVVSKKRSELKALILQDAQALYGLQMRLLRISAAEQFKRSPATMRVSPTLTKDMDRVMKESDAYMVSVAKGLLGKLLTSLLDHERKQLRNELRNVATERLQLARLQGGSAALSKSRRHVGLAFHWLLPDPFGSDARQSPLGPSDDAAFCSERLKADSLFFEFAPFDEIKAPKGETVETPQWDAVKKSAEKMVFRRTSARS